MPLFDPSLVTVIYVLGGPGAGKGTQCARLVRSHAFTHLSAGDLLRAEQSRPGSSHAALIKRLIAEGTIVPSEVTIALLKEAMARVIKDSPDGRARFLIDGFPRQMDQAHAFDEQICPCAFVLYLACTEQTMLVRLTERGKTSGRADDNPDSIRARFRTFENVSYPVIQYYATLDKVLKVDCEPEVEEVYETVCREFDCRLK